MAASHESIIIRPAREEDMGAVAEIYRPFVLSTLTTFAYEHEAPSTEDMVKRFKDLSAGGFPWLVAEIASTSVDDEPSPADRIVGFAYVGPFRTRAGWRFTVEDSIYLREGHRQRGLGAKLLSALLDECRARKYHTVIAAISIDESTGDGAGSVALHSKAGFKECGRIKDAGWKFERWCDCVFMQLALS